MTNKPMLSVEQEPVAWAVEISGCLKFFEQKKSAENARRRYEKVMDAERMEPFPLFAEQPAPVAVVMAGQLNTFCDPGCPYRGEPKCCRELVEARNRVKP